MNTKLSTITVDEDGITVDGGVRFRIGEIRVIVFDRDGNRGRIEISESNSSKKHEFFVSLATAYFLIVALGTKSWVDL